MKVVILAGGLKSVIDDYDEGIPKPMAEVGERPILWHIMKYFSSYGLNEFVICGGYKLEDIKEYFTDYYLYQSDITVDLATNKVEIHEKRTEDWKVTIADTGLYSSVGGRVKRVEKYIDGEMFLVVYGDCLSDIDLNSLIAQHKTSGKMATICVARPTGRNRPLAVQDGLLLPGGEKDSGGSGAWTDACCMVFNRDIFPYLPQECGLQEQLQELAKKEQVGVYKHSGFWMPIETKRDKVYLEGLIKKHAAPWIKWQ